MKKDFLGDLWNSGRNVETGIYMCVIYRGKTVMWL